MKIGELASATATKVETVRYYEKIGLLPPPARTSANYRAYGTEHLARLSFIRRARDLGFTLEAVRELLTLSDDKAQSCEAVDGIARVHLDEIDRKIGDFAPNWTALSVHADTGRLPTARSSRRWVRAEYRNRARRRVQAPNGCLRCATNALQLLLQKSIGIGLCVGPAIGRLHDLKRLPHQPATLLGIVGNVD